MTNNNTVKKRTLFGKKNKRVLTFFSLGTILFMLLTHFMIPKWNYPRFVENLTESVDEFRITEKAAIDVFFLGSSHIDDGILDSFDIIAIVGELNETFDISIEVEDLEPDNFNTVQAMLELVKKLQV